MKETERKQTLARLRRLEKARRFSALKLITAYRYKIPDSAH